MKYFRILLLSHFIVLCCNLFAQNNNPYQFINPKPFSIMVSKESNIILRHSSIIDRSSLSNDLLRVEGSISGFHSGELILSDDNKTIVFNPDNKFSYNEDVNVLIMKGIKTDAGKEIPQYAFQFSTELVGIVQTLNTALSDTYLENQYPAELQKIGNSTLLPAPPITIDSLDNPAEGHIFMATWDRNVPAKYGNFVMILDKNGAIVDSLRVKGAPYDFRVQQNGLLTFALGDFASSVPLPGEELQYMVLDSNLAVVDSFKMKNGYIADFHEFKMLPNGHVMMMSYHTIIYDMSKVVEGGKTDAELVINIIQEQDRDKNVVFEWRNIDYIPITDSDEDLTGSRINYGTLNAFDVEDNGNILASFRNHSEIMQISRTTGEVLWRMGGPRREFTFVGEHEENAPYYHARQHNICRRPNGNITMFDNGEFHKPPYSRAVEYSLDEVNKVATLVSEWRYPSGNIFCVTAGNAEPLSNGGWFIGFGVPNPQFVKRNAVEVHSDGSIALEFSLPNGVLAYRVTKFPWKGSVNKQSYSNFEVKEGNRYSFNNESIITGVDIKYNLLSSPDYNEAKITRLPYGPVDPEFIDNIITVSPVSIIYEGFAISSQTSEIFVDLTKYPEIEDPENTTIYYRTFPNQGLFVPKSTTYDKTANELTATLNGFGEIVFGVPIDDIDNNGPILYEPLNKQKLLLQDSITVKWTGKGIYDSFNVQVSTDSTFGSVLQETNTNLSDFSVFGLTNNKKYFWRVNSVLDGMPSQWSEVWSFNITDEFISTVIPSGGEIWVTGTSEIIRWETNILENVIINLVQEDNTLFSLDTLLGSYQAYEWNLPKDLAACENYKIHITSESNSAILGTSEGVFAIIDTITSVVEHKNLVPSEYNLEQNYPNPFNPTSTIRYAIPKVSFVRIGVFDILGKEIKVLVNEEKNPGIYETIFNAKEFASGIYFYKISAAEFTQSKKMIFMK